MIFFPGCYVAGALREVAPEALDLVAGHLAEIVVERLARFELLAVDQQGAGPCEAVTVVVVIAEQRQAAVFEHLRAVLLLAVEAGDVVVNEL